MKITEEEAGKITRQVLYLTTIEVTIILVVGLLNDGLAHKIIGTTVGIEQKPLLIAIAGTVAMFTWALTVVLWIIDTRYQGVVGVNWKKAAPWVIWLGVASPVMLHYAEGTSQFLTRLVTGF